jgi:hypothetical protein
MPAELDVDIELPEEGMGELKEIKRLPQMQKRAPNIQWGAEYKAWPLPRRLKYAERLASSMNHAADVLQTERNKLLEVVAHQEAQLKANTKAYVGQGEVMHKELGDADAEKQELYKKIVALKKQVKAQAIRIKQLEA